MTQKLLTYTDAAEAEVTNILGRPASYYFDEIVKANVSFDVSKIRSVVLFGAGMLVGEYLSLCEINGIEVRAIADNDPRKRGTRIGDVPVISIDDLLAFPRNTPIIVTTIHERAVLLQLRELGFHSSWSYTFVSSMEPEKFSNPVWCNQTRSTLDHPDDVLRGLEVFEDELSRRTYVQALKHRVFLDSSHLDGIWRPAALQYFDGDVLRFGPGEAFVDGGAYNGDTVLQFLEACGGEYHSVHAFEPSPGSFSRLQTVVTGLSDPRIHIYPYALGSAESVLTFAGDAKLGFRAASAGTITARCVPLDQVLTADERVTFIKLDVEGAEKEALRGARHLIRKQRPKMVVCLYHKAEDIWELPLLIKDLGDYRVVLRKYDDGVFDLVCYAF